MTIDKLAVKVDLGFLKLETELSRTNLNLEILANNQQEMKVVLNEAIRFLPKH
jgi:hypothetical protein